MSVEDLGGAPKLTAFEAKADTIEPRRRYRAIFTWSSKSPCNGEWTIGPTGERNFDSRLRGDEPQPVRHATDPINDEMVRGRLYVWMIKCSDRAGTSELKRVTIDLRGIPL